MTASVTVNTASQLHHDYARALQQPPKACSTLLCCTQTHLGLICPSQGAVAQGNTSKRSAFGAARNVGHAIKSKISKLGNAIKSVIAPTGAATKRLEVPAQLCWELATGILHPDAHAGAAPAALILAFVCCLTSTPRLTHCCASVHSLLNCTGRQRARARVQGAALHV